MPALTDYISVSEAAAMTRVHSRHVCRLLAAGTIRGEKISPRKWLVLRKSAQQFRRSETMGRPKTVKPQ